MGIIRLRDIDSTALPTLPLVGPDCPAVSPSKPVRLTRRGLFRTTGGALVAGAALAAGILPPRSAQAQGIPQPRPIPGGSPAIQEMGGGQLFHVFGPGPEGAGLDPIDAEPSTITDFMGSVGLAYLNGTVTRTDTVTGEVRTLPTVGSDMRFMQGRYRSTDGQIREGAFAFV